MTKIRALLIVLLSMSLVAGMTSVAQASPPGPSDPPGIAEDEDDSKESGDSEEPGDFDDSEGPGDGDAEPGSLAEGTPDSLLEEAPGETPPGVAAFGPLLAGDPTTPYSLAAAYRPDLPFDFVEPTTLYDYTTLPAVGGRPEVGLDFSNHTAAVPRVVLADVDGSGTDDIVSYVFEGFSGASARVLRGVVVQRTDGFGDIEPGTIYTMPGEGSNNFRGDLAVGDVDGDDDLDIVVTWVGGTDKTITTLLNHGDGTFPEFVTTDTAVPLDRDLTLAYMDDDEVLDAVAASKNGGRGTSSSVQILLGNGDGTFRPDPALADHPITQSDMYLGDVIPLDVDGDGTLELLTIAFNSYVAATIWTKDDDGVWQPDTAALANTAAKSAFVGDFDGDGHLDIALQPYYGNNTLYTFLGDGTGAFGARVEHFLPLPMYWPGDDGAFPRYTGETYDVDGDRNVDIVMTGARGEAILLYGDGAGGFGESAVYAGMAGWDPGGADGWDDPAVSGYGMLRTGMSITVGDVTGDDIPDILYGNQRYNGRNLVGFTAAGLYLIEGLGDRQFGAARAERVTDLAWRSGSGSSGEYRDAAVADWDGDGWDDLIIVRFGAVQVARGVNGGFERAVAVAAVSPQCADGLRGTDILVADVNGDGHLDLVCGDYEVLVYLGDGDGGLDGVINLGPASNSNSVDIFRMELADLDADGADDLVYVSHLASSQDNNAPMLGWARNCAAASDCVAVGAGFAAPEYFSEVRAIPAGTSPVYPWAAPAVSLGDFNGDGRIDLAALMASTNGNDAADDGRKARLVTVLSDRPDAGGAPAFTVTTQRLDPDDVLDGAYTRLEAVDIDGDDVLDLIATDLTGSSNYGDDTWQRAVLRGHADGDGKADGTFTIAQRFPSSAGLGAHRFADLNGDGIVDLIAGTNYRGVEFREGLADGTFGPPQVFGTPSGDAIWLELVDIDHDGDLDVIARSKLLTGPDASLIILENDGGRRVGGIGESNLQAASLEWQPGPDAAAGTEGDPVTGIADGTVEVVVTNTGDFPIRDPWVDTIWLSDDDSYDIGDTLLAQLPHTRTLGATQSVAASVDVTITPRRDGPAYLLLRTDTRGQIAETDEDDNLVAIPIHVRLPAVNMPDGATPGDTAITGGGHPVLLSMPGITEPMRLTLAGEATGLSVGAGAVPTATVAEARLTAPGTLTLLPGEARYLAVDVPAGAAATVTVQPLPFGVGSVRPRLATNLGTVTFTLTGINLDGVTEATATAPGGVLVTGTVISTSADTMIVQFDLGGRPVGEYAITVSDGTATSSLGAAFRVVAGVAGATQTTLLVPYMARMGASSATAKLLVVNTGLTDVAAPFVRIRSNGASDPTPAGPFEIGDFFVVPDVAGAPAGVVPPGVTTTVDIPFGVSGGEDHIPGETGVPRGFTYSFLMSVYDGSVADSYDPAVDFATELAALGLTALTDGELADAGGDPENVPADVSERVAQRQAVLDELTGLLGITRATYYAGLQQVRAAQPADSRSDDPTVLRTAAFAAALTAAAPVTPPGWPVVSGTVTDADGVPVAGRPVTVTATDDAMDTVQATTDDDGLFRFDGISPGTHELSVTTEHGLVVMVPLDIDDEADTPVTVDIELPELATGSGTVVSSAGGAPVSGAQLSVANDAFDTGVVSATTGPDGGLALDNLLLGPATVRLEAPGYVTAVAHIEVASGDNDLGEFRLDPAVTITGTVLDAAGDPVELAVVSAGSMAVADTAADGSFTLEGAPRGEITVLAFEEEKGSGTIVIDTAVTTTATVTLHPQADLQITVVDDDDQPVAAQSIVVSAAGSEVDTVWTADDGVAYLRVPYGSYALAAGGTQATVEVATASVATRLQVHTATVTGSLPDAYVLDDDGVMSAVEQPSSAVPVWLLVHGALAAVAVTDDDGAFTLDGPVGAEAELWVLDAHLGVIRHPLTLGAAGASTEVGELSAAGRTVTVTVDWADGSYVPPLLMQLQRDGLDTRVLTPLAAVSPSDPFAEHAPAVMVDDHTIEIRNVPDGDFLIRALQLGVVDDTVPEDDMELTLAPGGVIVTVAGADTDVRMDIPPWVTASGTAEYDGAPAAGALVTLTDTVSGRQYFTSTDDDGHWETPVVPGTFDLVVWDLDRAVPYAAVPVTFSAPQPFRSSPRALQQRMLGAFLAEGESGFEEYIRLYKVLRSQLSDASHTVYSGFEYLYVESVSLLKKTPLYPDVLQRLQGLTEPEDVPDRDPAVIQALSTPIPEQPDDMCYLLDTRYLLAAQNAAYSLDVDRELMEEVNYELRRQLAMQLPEMTVLSLKVINNVLKIAAAVWAIAEWYAATAAATAATAPAAQLGFFERIAAYVKTTALELVGDAVKNWNLLNNAVKGVLTAIDALIGDLRYDSGKSLRDNFGTVKTSADSVVGLLKVFAATTLKLAKDSFGTLAFKAYDLISSMYNLVSDFKGMLKQLESITMLVANMRDSYDLQLKNYRTKVEKAVPIIWLNLQMGVPLLRRPHAPDSCYPDDPDDERGPIRGTAWRSHDPNEIVGPQGAGDGWVHADATLGYQIHFENVGPGTDPEHLPAGVDPASTSPASLVTVTLPLPSGVDLDSVVFGEFGFGSEDGDNAVTFTPVAGSQGYSDTDANYQITVPDTYDRDATEDLTLTLTGTAWLDRAANTANWQISLVDPETGLAHANPMAGFLPPEPGGDEAGAGMGFVTISLRMADAPSGTTVAAKASIVFDDNDAIETNTWTNRLDRTAPTAAVSGAASTAVGAPVTVLGTDAHSGVEYVDVYRAINDGPLVRWKSRVAPGDVAVDGEVGQRIALAARAIDRVGNAGPAPMAATFTTTLAAANPGSPGNGDGSGSSGAGSGSSGSNGPAVGVLPDNASRAAGTNRYGTARQIADLFGTADAVIVANGENHKQGFDALAANYLAGLVRAPIVLTQAGRLPAESLAAVCSVLAGSTAATRTIYILGGTDSVSAAVAAALARPCTPSLGNVRVVRIDGDNRYETAAMIATGGPASSGASHAATVSLPAGTPRTVILASGVVNADALAAGALSARFGIPVLLTAPDRLPTATADALVTLRAERVVVLGGPDRVSAAVRAQLRQLGVDEVITIAGRDRFETSALLAAWARTPVADGGLGQTDTTVAIANGLTGFPDALAAGPLLGLRGGMLLLTPPAVLPESLRRFLAGLSKAATTFLALGSPGTVSNSVVVAAAKAVG